MPPTASPIGIEVLDDPAADTATVRRMLAEIATANRWFGGVRAVTRGLGALLDHRDRGRTLTLLDIGTGAGDLPRAASRWAARRGITLRTIGVERHRAAAQLATDGGVPTVVACGTMLPFRGSPPRSAAEAAARHATSVQPHPDAAARHATSVQPHPDAAARHVTSVQPHPDAAARHVTSVQPHPDAAARHEPPWLGPRSFRPPASRAASGVPAVDIVLLSQLLHHFDDDGAAALLGQAAAIARRGVIVADLRPSRPAAMLFRAAGRVLRFAPATIDDGVTSLARGRDARTLAALVRRTGIAPAVAADLPFARVMVAWRSPR